MRPGLAPRFWSAAIRPLIGWTRGRNSALLVLNSASFSSYRPRALRHGGFPYACTHTHKHTHTLSLSCALSYGRGCRAGSYRRLKTRSKEVRESNKRQRDFSPALCLCMRVSLFFSLFRYVSLRRGRTWTLLGVNIPAGVHRTIHTHTLTPSHTHTVHCSQCRLNECWRRNRARKQECERGEEKSLELLLVALGFLCGLRMISLLLTLRQWDLV